MKRLITVFLAAIATAAHADKAIDVKDPWIRHLPGDRPMAGYFVVENKGDTDRRLSGASSPAFGDIQMHRTVQGDGTSTMEPVDLVMVPALGTVEFVPGGYHLMLMRRQRPLEVGEEVPVTLELDDGGSQAAVFTIKPSWQE